MRRTVLRAGLAVATLAACTSEPAPRETRELVDSAGVTIVTSHTSEWSIGRNFVLADEPLIEIGVEQGEGAYQLSGVVGAFRFRDGSIVICNAADRTVRYYSPGGAHTRTVGGQGQGPSELRRISRCIFTGLEVWAYQAPALPVERFDSVGGQLDPVQIPRPGGRVAQLADVNRDGEMVLQQNAPRRDLPSGVSVLTAAIFRTDTTGEARLIGEFDASTWVRSDRVAFPRAFSPTLSVADASGLTVVGWPESWDLRVFDSSGRLDRRLRIARELESTSSADRGVFVTRVLEGPMPAGDTPYQDADVRREIVDMMVYPDHFPAYYRVIVGSSNDVILAERGDAPRDPLPQVAEPYDATTTWDFMTPDGTWLGFLELPPRFDPMDLDGDYLIGVHHDELGIERVRVYEIVPEDDAGN